ncbi:unnamed protein product [Moneuplotes crassus]|uniref:Uncharacterized protein n=1 Tax=Euplotes crassus TaxID=5936 RepID=A0AAD1XPR6_EUPCR|nr:unnamed protein product [Moneuplotes crassus]
MTRSLSVDVNLNRRGYPYSRLSQAIRNAQHGGVDDTEWRRAFLNTHRRIISSSLERKLIESSNVYTEKNAIDNIVPKLQKGAEEIFCINRNYDRRDIFRAFSLRTMSLLEKSEIQESDKIMKAMQIVPSCKRIKKAFKQIVEEGAENFQIKKYSSHKLALLKVCLDLREAYYKTCKPIFNLAKLLNTLVLQREIAEYLQEDLAILYIRTLTNQEIYQKLGLLLFKESLNRIPEGSDPSTTLNYSCVHYTRLIKETELLLSEVTPTQYYE